jgi:hypothetical protein
MWGNKLWKIWGGISYMPGIYEFITNLVEFVIRNKPQTSTELSIERVWYDIDDILGQIHRSVLTTFKEVKYEGQT